MATHTPKESLFINAGNSFLMPDMLHNLARMSPAVNCKALLSAHVLADYLQREEKGDADSLGGKAPLVLREDLFFPRDQVWLVDDNCYILAKIVNLRVEP